MEHTPGPWWDECDGHDTSRKIRANNTEHPLATVVSYWKGNTNPGREVRNANARLMAAAPELLEALKKIAALKGTEENEWDAVERLIPHMAEIARAAIAKATQP